ncbi:helix-turn-helix domain-containing protein [Bacillus thuringiensis]|uniref:helix-turn-helix domain-containing protein n=1 Tax=Bacillus thuringiensis TaxID=1428 RepID=UPI0004ABE6DC|nr:helix-turn-helix transcriptional regulator [Bacillus thuringiensis]AIE31540.1 helix-turn-helix domain-containing protein [Bacillus thuringiensis serovar kurstaki str. HD-1]MCR6840447.1 helix-turn-helix transcriptional regulator [Bacillus thuringiensis]MEB9602655.1 helix-turn-helix transcriptional regulator [Bacillus cereus]WCH16941.1 helix-turn-helix transcriptional regulator [Bacillus thuringiensis]
MKITNRQNDDLEVKHLSIGMRIRHIRKEKKITQGELARMLGFSGSSAISYIENGQRKLNADKIPKLAESLGVTIEEIFLNESRQNDDKEGEDEES